MLPGISAIPDNRPRLECSHGHTIMAWVNRHTTEFDLSVLALYTTCQRYKFTHIVGIDSDGFITYTVLQDEVVKDHVGLSMLSFVLCCIFKYMSALVAVISACSLELYLFVFIQSAVIHINILFCEIFLRKLSFNLICI